MLTYLRRHHIGLLALFVALGGTTYAATSLPAGSVGSRQLRNGSVTRAKLSPQVVALLHGGATKAPTWRDPDITSQIAAAGQKSVVEKVVSVRATSPWVDAGVSIQPGQLLWADTRSDGRWSGNPSLFPYSDANGLSVYPGRYRVYANAPVESLIGFVGSSPPTPREVSVPIGANPGGPGGITNTGLLEVGDTLHDFTSATIGEVWLRNNDNTNYYSDAGKQIVKVIVAAGAS